MDTGLEQLTSDLCVEDEATPLRTPAYSPPVAMPPVAMELNNSSLEVHVIHGKKFLFSQMITSTLPLPAYIVCAL